MAVGDLTILADVKTGLLISNTTRDTEIAALITAASTAISRRYDREFYDKGTLTRRIEVGGGYVSLYPFELRAATTLVLNPEATTPTTLVSGTDYLLQPTGSNIAGTYTALQLSNFVPFTSNTFFRFGFAFLDVTGTWGMLTVPADVARACIITVGSWLDRGVADYGINSGNPREDAPDRVSTWAIPAAAHALLMPYARMETV